MNTKVRVLVIDDSALMRQLLTTILTSDSGIEVVGTAPDPVLAQAKIEALAPDVLTLDVEMPKMDGLAFLERLMRTRPTPVVMVSSLTERGCEVTLRALELGALDFVTKPKIDVSRGTVELGAELIAKVKSAARARLRQPRKAPIAPIKNEAISRLATRYRTTQRIVAIGSSTGGTEALTEVFTALPADAPPIVVVQHMPPVFTQHFAARLDRICKVRVREARDGDALVAGQVLIAPGGERHLEVVRSGAAYGVQLVAAPPVGHHRPSVDVLFTSCARAAGHNATGVILTGMGADGAAGLLAMRRAGSITIAQDEASCVVFGMPREAIARGAAERIVPLERISEAVLSAAADTTKAKTREDAR
jgi:two-component system chemotaxis response regulator CheB